MFRRLFGSRARHQYDVGIDHFNAGRMADAVACFDATLDEARDASDPDATLARFYRAEANGRLGRQALADDDPRRAIEHFDAAIEDQPGYPDLHLQRALALLETEDPLAAERAALRALELNPELVDAAVTQVVALHEQGQTTRARDLAGEWSDRAATQGSAMAPLLREPSTALAGLRAIRHARQNQRKAIERVEGLLHEGLWAKAEEILDSLLAETPDYPDLRLRMAACRAAQGDAAGALAHLDVALERNADYRDGRVLAGIIELRRSHLVSARDHFARARDLGSRSSPVVYGLALCDLRFGRVEAAYEQLQEIWKTEKPGLEARALRASILGRLGQTTAARAAFDEVLGAHVGLDVRLDAVAFGLASDQLDLARAALDDLPPGSSDPGLLLARAEVLWRSGDTERCIDVLEAATADHPDHPAILWLLAQVHAQRDHPEVALRRLSNLEALGFQVAGATALAARLLRETDDPDGARGRLEDPEAVHADPTIGLELLYTLRALGETDAARRQWVRWAPMTTLDPAWRIQDPARWLGPIPVWPSQEAEVPVS